MLRSTTLCWNSAHVAKRRFRNSSVSRIGIRYTHFCSIQTRLYQPHLHRGCSKSQRAVLPRRVAVLPAIHSIAGDVFVFHRVHDIVELLRCETPQFISPDVWPANSPNLNPVDYRICGILQVYRLPIRDKDELGKRFVATWAEFQHNVVDDVASLWTLAVTVLAWHSSCYTSQPVLFRAANANPQPALFRATNVWGGTQHYLQSDDKVLHFTS